MIYTRVHGLGNVRRKFVSLQDDAERAAKMVVARSALAIHADAKSMAPVDTGRLRNSIAFAFGSSTGGRSGVDAPEANFDSEMTVTGAEFSAGLGRVSRGAAGLSARVGTNLEYAPYIEFGTSNTPAQPFLHPAAEAERDHFLRDLAAAVKVSARRVL